MSLDDVHVVENCDQCNDGEQTGVLDENIDENMAGPGVRSNHDERKGGQSRQQSGVWGEKNRGGHPQKTGNYYGPEYEEPEGEDQRLPVAPRSLLGFLGRRECPVHFERRDEAKADRSNEIRMKDAGSPNHQGSAELELIRSKREECVEES